MCRRMLSFPKHFLHDLGQGSVSMFHSPTAEWRQWEVQHSISSEALQKNLVMFFKAFPSSLWHRAACEEERLPWEGLSVPVGYYLPYVTWLQLVPARAHPPECPKCQKIRAQLAQQLAAAALFLKHSIAPTMGTIWHLIPKSSAELMLPNNL